MSRAEQTLSRLLQAATVGFLVALFLLLFVNVIARTFQLAGFAWFDEAVQGLFAWMVFLGAAALWCEQDHFQVTWLQDALPPKPSRILKFVILILALLFLCAMTWYGASLTLQARAVTPILNIPTSIFYAAIPVSGAVMIVTSIVELFKLTNQKDPLS